MDEQLIIKKKTRKPLLFIAMLSMFMMFAGLTSAYIVSKHSTASTWREIDLPPAFLWSTVAIVLSSILLFIASKQLKQANFTQLPKLTGLALALGVAFTIFQFAGFDQLFELKHYAAGEKSTAASSYIYALVILHLAHMFTALISLLVVTIRAFQNKYTKEHYLGFELAAMFWHFLGLIWLYLYIFLNTVNAV
ncbi:MAG: cytochrome c oxidase subunit 3 [Flavobacteriales bacterium]